MDLTHQLLAGGLVLVFALALLRIFSAPLKAVVRVALNTALGFLALRVLELTAGFTGLTLGLNPLNALIIGIFGLPGLLLLLLLSWVL